MRQEKVQVDLETQREANGPRPPAARGRVSNEGMTRNVFQTVWFIRKTFSRGRLESKKEKETGRRSIRGTDKRLGVCQFWEVSVSSWDFWQEIWQNINLLRPNHSLVSHSEEDGYRDEQTAEAWCGVKFNLKWEQNQIEWTTRSCSFLCQKVLTLAVLACDHDTQGAKEWLIKKWKMEGSGHHWQDAENDKELFFFSGATRTTIRH